MKDTYNTRYFGERFNVGEYEFDGFEARDLLERYFNLREFDFENQVIKVSISKIPLLNENLEYIISILYEDDNDIFEKLMDDNGMVRNRSLAILYILFASSAKYFSINDKQVKLRSELALLNPIKARHELEPAIKTSEVKKAKLLNKYMGYAEILDKIAILARKHLIERFGDEIFKSTFAAFQIDDNGNKQSLNVTNKNIISWILSSSSNKIKFRTI